MILETNPNTSGGSVDITTLAKESKQDTGNNSLSNIDSNIGAKSDVSASSDTGTFSLIALFKRLLDKLTNIISVKITDGAGIVNSRALGSQLINGDIGLVTNSIIHGETTGGTYIWNISIGASGSNTLDLTDLDLFIAPGELGTFCAVASANTNFNLSVNWTEDI